MKNKRKIGIDLDDVLADFHTAIRNYHNAVYRTSLKEEDFTTYMFNRVWGGTLKEAIQKVNDFHHSEYSKWISPILDSVESINSLSKKNELFVITSRPIFIKEKSEEWIKMFFGNNFSGVFFSSNHYSKAGGKSKSQICKELEVSLLIDDSLDYINHCCTIGIRGILFGDYPWNQNGNLPESVVRVKNWREVLGELI